MPDRAVIFDLDGTLADTAADLVAHDLAPGFELSVTDAED